MRQIFRSTPYANRAKFSVPPYANTVECEYGRNPPSQNNSSKVAENTLIQAKYGRKPLKIAQKWLRIPHNSPKMAETLQNNAIMANNPSI